MIVTLIKQLSANQSERNTPVMVKLMFTLISEKVDTFNLLSLRAFSLSLLSYY